jgi:micrococcal nuclease
MDKTSKGAYLLFIFTVLFLLVTLTSFLTNAPALPKSISLLPTATPTSTPTVTLKPSVDVKGESALAEEFYPVIKVVDGDTVTISINGKNETLRLIGINTPETVDPRRPVECYGQEASAAAKRMLTGKTVRLEADETQSERDRYDRLLRYIYLEDGTFVNKWMIQEGFAYEYTYDMPYKYQKEFKAAQRAAQEQQKGLWNPTTCKNTITPSIGSLETENKAQEFANVSVVSGDKDCKDFTSQSEAQSFFFSQGGPSADPHKLDSDKDGVVCESLP